MKDKVKKYKRPPVDWVTCLHNCKRQDVETSYYLFMQSHKGMSVNRCAYNVLKKYYSTTALKKYRYEKFPLMDVDRKSFEKKCKEYGIDL